MGGEQKKKSPEWIYPQQQSQQQLREKLRLNFLVQTGPLAPTLVVILPAQQNSK